MPPAGSVWPRVRAVRAALGSGTWFVSFASVTPPTFNHLTYTFRLDSSDLEELRSVGSQVGGPGFIPMCPSCSHRWAAHSPGGRWGHERTDQGQLVVGSRSLTDPATARPSTAVPLFGGDLPSGSGVHRTQACTAAWPHPTGSPGYTALAHLLALRSLATSKPPAASPVTSGPAGQLWGTALQAEGPPVWRPPGKTVHTWVLCVQATRAALGVRAERAEDSDAFQQGPSQSSWEAP